MEHVKKHFNDEATIYDINIKNLIPYYNQMVEAIISSIPYEKTKRIKVIDFGCGTGTISKAVKMKYPDAEITCVDIAENMLEVAKDKLKEYDDINYVLADFQSFELDKKYDLVVSSLALHHLTTDKCKQNLYLKCYENLNQNGYFFNADVVLASSDMLQQVYMDKWIEYMKRNVSEEEVQNTWLPTYYNEDCPAKLADHIKWLAEIGFKDVDVIWKYYNFAVYCGRKQ